MLIDTDVLVWFFRGNRKAAKTIDRQEYRYVSVVTYMELLQGARDKTEAQNIRAFFSKMHFQMTPLTENIGHRAAIYMEEYGLKTALCMGDALIAATSVENDLLLLTGNQKHFKIISELKIERFRP